MADLPWMRFERRWKLDPLPPAGEPLFALAAGWRSGSTLLQRMLCSSREVLVWGEPYGRAGLLPAMCRSLLALDERWPTPGHFPPTEVLDHPDRHWIANLYPPPEALRAGMRAALDAWLAAPARERGFPRFGLKEVRLHAIEARFLQWLLPDARFVFLVRDPWAAWSSARGGAWMLRWPRQVVTGARDFAAHWRRLAESFLAWGDDSGMLVRYEELAEPSVDLSPLAEHCRLRGIDPAVRSTVIRGLRTPPQALDPAEIEAIREAAGPVAEALGYRPPSAEEAA